MKNFYYYKYYWILKTYKNNLGYNYWSAIVLFTGLIFAQFFSLMNFLFLFSEKYWTSYFLTANRVLNRFVIWPAIIFPFFMVISAFYIRNKKSIHRLVRLYETENIEKSKKNGRCIKKYIIITMTILLLSSIGSGLVKHEIKKTKKTTNTSKWLVLKHLRQSALVDIPFEQ